MEKQYEKLNAAHKSAFKAHITINDIHFAIVARNFMFYLLLEELMADDLEPMVRIEIQATLFYMYAGWVVPTYVHTRSARTPPSLPSHEPPLTRPADSSGSAKTRARASPPTPRGSPAGCTSPRAPSHRSCR